LLSTSYRPGDLPSSERGSRGRRRNSNRVIPPYTWFFQRRLAHDKREAINILESSLKNESLAAGYDSILIPALTLVEMERQKGELEESTVPLIRNNTSEMVDELGFRALEEKYERAQTASDSLDPMSSPKILVIPVRDGSDNLISTMLVQVLDQSGFHVASLPVQRIDETVATVTEEKPDIVFLSGMPPVAMARAHRIFRGRRSANPALKIIMGIWHYNEDPVKAAQMIRRTEDLHTSRSLADAIAKALVHAEPKPAVPEPLDESPQLVATPTDTAA
jgi:hypothetical protein